MNIGARYITFLIRTSHVGGARSICDTFPYLPVCRQCLSGCSKCNLLLLAPVCISQQKKISLWRGKQKVWMETRYMVSWINISNPIAFSHRRRLASDNWVQRYVQNWYLGNKETESLSQCRIVALVSLQHFPGIPSYHCPGPLVVNITRDSSCVCGGHCKLRVILCSEQGMNQKTWVLFPALCLTCCVFLAESLHLCDSISPSTPCLFVLTINSSGPGLTLMYSA